MSSQPHSIDHFSKPNEPFCVEGVLVAANRNTSPSKYNRPALTSVAACRSIASLRSAPVRSKPNNLAVSTTKSSPEISTAWEMIVDIANWYSAGAIIVARRSGIHASPSD